MFPSLRRLWPALLLCATTLFTSSASAQVAVLTHHNDNARTGANLNETILTPANVNVNRFGKLFTRQVDGEIYAQPLVVPNLTIGGRTRNVVYVVTMHDGAYAFDADDPNAASPLWVRSFINPGAGITAVPVSDVGNNCGTYRDISAEIGILSTPVIDLNTKRIYMVVRTKERVNNVVSYVQRLRALSLTTGQDVLPPTVIQGNVPGTGDSSVNGRVYFDTRTENQRAALLLSRGQIYIAWAGHCDTGPYHGWVMRYDAATLAQTGILCVTPNGWGGGIWQSGQGLAADANGNVYAVVGNGSDSARDGGQDYGNSILKIASNQAGLYIADWFMPHNTQQLNNWDADLCGGPMLIPGTNLVLGSGKEGIFYLLNTANMGHFRAEDDSQIVQAVKVTDFNHVHSGTIFWNSPDGQRLFMWPERVPVKSFRFQNGLSSTVPVTQSGFSAPNGMSGGFLSVTSNGSQAGTGIVWANINFSGDSNQEVRPGILRAFDATDLSKELWNSEVNSARDRSFNYSKFCPPTVANGKVYLPTFSNQLIVYGLFPPPSAPYLQVPVTGNRYVSLNWTVVNNASSYVVYRAGPDGNFGTVAVFVPTNHFVDTGLTNGVTYRYFITALNARGESAHSNTRLAVPTARKTDAPTGLAAFPGNTQIALTWNTTPGADSYTIRRAFAATGPFLIIGTATTNGFTNSGLTNNKKYYYVVTGVNSAGESGISTIVNATPQALTAAFNGEYYNDPGNGTFFNSLALNRADPAINFSWGSGAPAAGVQSDNFSVRWTGIFYPQYTDNYTFYTTSDDGVRLWVNNVLLIDRWIDQGATQVNQTVRLAGSRGVPVVMEYYEKGGDAVAKLHVSSPRLSYQPIGSGHLLPTTFLAGRINLEGCRNPAQSITFNFRAPGSIAVLFSRTVTLNFDGSFRLTGIAAGNYSLAVKGAKWLRKVVPVNLSFGPVAGLSVSLLAGDINNDNVVNADDVTLLKAAMNTWAGRPNYNPAADLNCDGPVSSLDASLLNANYGKSGDK